MGQVEQKKRQLELEKQSLQESLRTKQLELDAVNKVFWWATLFSKMSDGWLCDISSWFTQAFLLSSFVSISECSVYKIVLSNNS